MKIRGRSLAVCLGMVCLSAAQGQQYTIQTLTGNGSAGFVGDGGDPAAAQLSSPQSVALDSKGNVYIADTGNQRIRMISVSGGTITTIAGTRHHRPVRRRGRGHGRHPEFAERVGIRFQRQPIHCRYREQCHPQDHGHYDHHGCRSVTDRVSGYGGDGGPATSANLNGPTAVAVDAQGNLYIADTGNNLIRKVDAKTGIITTYVGGTGGTLGTSGKLSAPNGLWFDASGALYIADSNNARVARYVPPSAFSNFAGNGVAGFKGDGGPATVAQLNKPVGITMDAAGNIYIADMNNSRIRKILADGTITTIAGKGGAAYSGDGGSATAAVLNFPAQRRCAIPTARSTSPTRAIT